MSRDFRKLLEAQWEQGKFLCVGLDPDLEKIPESARKEGTRETLVNFNRAVVDATKDIVCAYKPNTAFYEAHGDEGWNALRETIQHINEVGPEIPVILDAKRGDIGNTNEGYAQSAFDHLHADAITVQPYGGGEALSALFARADKGIIVWCRSSNGGAGEFQDLLVDRAPLYMVVARHVAKGWNKSGNCGLVVGATYPEELAAIRAEVGDMFILIPGVGAQGGDLAKSVAAGKDRNGKGFVISTSRVVLYASQGADFAQAARRTAEELHGAITKAL